LDSLPPDGTTRRRRREMRVSVGVDLHKGQFTVYWRSEGVGKGVWGKYTTSEPDYQLFEAQLRAVREEGHEVRVAVESTGNTRYFKRRVESVGVEVVVINTMKFKVVTESVKKTDRRDAETIAEFLEKDMLPEARLCSTESEELRRLLRVRGVLVRSVVAVKNQVHGMLMSLGIEMPKGALQSAKGRRRALDVLEEQGHAGAAVEPLLDTIEALEGQVKKLEGMIRRKIAGDVVVQLLMTIPGAGLITASTIRAYVDDIRRYPSEGELSGHAGLAPWVNKSNEKEHYGSITKRGPEELRTALVQVVLGMVRLKRRTGEYRLMQRYTTMKSEKGTGKAIIATARKLSVVVWHMLRNNEPFDEARMTDPKIRRVAAQMRAAVMVA
jgi:transposase